MKFFEHFQIKELFNTCTEVEVRECVRNGYLDSLLVLLSILEDFRNEIDYPIIITSSFRGFHHNKRVGGSPTSQHLLGQAIDFKCSDERFETMVRDFQDFLERTSKRYLLGQIICYKNRKFIHVALRCPKHNQLMFMFSLL